jgi:Flp pilus assembly protein TadG
MLTNFFRKQLGTRGNAMVEFALFAPVMFVALLATVDLGVYTFAFISVENAARAAALRNSSGMESATDQETACAIVIDALRGLPNVNSSFQSSCNGAPITVTSVRCDASVPCTASVPSADGSPAAAVTVSYRVPDMFRMPVPGPTVITRTSQMRVRNIQ